MGMAMVNGIGFLALHGWLLRAHRWYLGILFVRVRAAVHRVVSPCVYFVFHSRSACYTCKTGGGVCRAFAGCFPYPIS